jgi:hypothetical protein
MKNCLMMKTMIARAVSLSFALFFTTWSGLFSQSDTTIVSIVPNGSVYIPSSTSCQTIILGDSLNFTRGVNCDPLILLSDEDGASERDTTFTTDNFSYTFSESGLYAFFCGSPSTDLAGGIATVCYNVITPAPIPSSSYRGIAITMFCILTLVFFYFKRIY